MQYAVDNVLTKTAVLHENEILTQYGGARNVAVSKEQQYVVENYPPLGNTDARSQPIAADHGLRDMNQRTPFISSPKVFWRHGLDCICHKSSQEAENTHLSVLIDEHEGVGYVVITQMDHAATHPALHATLGVIQDLLQ